uniref:Uncharacterized protein n=1 Tax=Peronospora matthiolae TaxID=2874970 RepID=A0AAV1VH26_9STRA
MANVIAAEDDSNGWHEVEQTLTALELPSVPPTSDPQRLLGYVLHILPKYTEMEMLVTHLRLYASTLEQDMEQVKSHVRLLTRESNAEREKKQFLERYAAQVVKERNDLLHSRGSSKQKKASPGSHFVWHNCCKKNASHAMDLSPSILAFRGEKLQEAMKKVEALEGEVHNQELLRRELNFLLKKTQREHDSKVSADRTHIHHLEKQILQRSTLHSSLERKLYEVESVLARLDKTKEEELNTVNNRVKEAEARNKGLMEENASLHVLVKRLGDERDDVTQLLKQTTESKDLFAKRIDTLSEKCRALESEVEALRSEIEVLQTKDINDIRTQYAARISRLQRDRAACEEALHQEIDRLKQKLTKRDESLAQACRSHQSTKEVSSEDRPVSQTSGLEIVSDCGNGSKWSDGIFGDDRRFDMHGVELSFSRSDLPESHLSLDLSYSSSRHSALQKEAEAIESSASNQHYKQLSSCRSYTSSSKQGFSRALESISRDLSTSSNENDNQSRNHGADVNAFDEPFDWEMFIDSVSEISVLRDERKTMPFVNDSISEISLEQDGNTPCHSSSSIPRHSDLDVSATRHDDSFLRVPGSSFDAASPARADNLTAKQSEVNSECDRSSDAKDDRSVCNRSRHESERDEEGKRLDADGVDLTQERRCNRNSGRRTEQEQSGDCQESVMEGVAAENSFAHDIYQILNGLEQKRKEEEQKASQAEQALLDFQQLQQDFQALQVIPASTNESR